jgi:IS4 transposase
VHDVNILDQLVWEAGSSYIMDRGYLDFARWHRLHQCGACFVPRPVDKTAGLRFDQTIVMTGLKAKNDYPDPLRRSGYRDPITHRAMVFLTNNFTVPALTIAQRYRGRWQIERCFKWLKQHLRINAFYGPSPNAVRTQVWSASAVDLLVAILKNVWIWRPAATLFYRF